MFSLPHFLSLFVSYTIVFVIPQVCHVISQMLLYLGLSLHRRSSRMSKTMLCPPCSHGTARVSLILLFFFFDAPLVAYFF